MAIDFSTMQFNPATGETTDQKKKNLPYLNPNETAQGYLPYAGNQQVQQPAQPDLYKPNKQFTQNDLTQGNANAMGQAQTAAMNQQNNPLRQQTQAMTQKLMTNPNMGMDFQKYNAGMLSQYDANRAGMVDAYKQQNTGMGGSGQTQQNLIQLMMDKNLGRSQLENELDMSAYEQSQANYLNALGQGRSEAEGWENSQTRAIDNLLKVRGAYEGERSQTAANQQQMDVLDKTYGQDVAKMAIANGYDLAKLDKTFGQDMTKMIAQQNWQGAQNQLDREAEQAFRSKDLAQQMAIVEKQLAMDKYKTDSGIASTAEQNALNRALEVSLKDKDSNLARELVSLKAAVDKDQLLTQQDFQKTQNELDRKLQDAKMRGDWASAVEITKLKGEIDATAQKAQQQFSREERVASQTWSTSERVDKQSFDKAMSVLDYQQRLALQDDDQEAAKIIEDSRAQLQLKMQTNDFGQQEKMAYLNNRLEEAKANNDVERQKQILTFTHQQTLDSIEKQYGYDAALQNLRQEHEKAIKQGDWTNAQVLQQMQITSQEKMAAEDNALEQARIDLEKQGVDMKKMEQTYQYLAGEVEAGRADPSTLTSFVQGVAKQAGVTIKPPDPNATQKAAQKKYDDMVYQFGLTHPDKTVQYYVVNGEKIPKDQADQSWLKDAFKDAPIVTEIKPEGQSKFNEFFNSATYGELTQEQKAEKANAGKLTERDLGLATAGDTVVVGKQTTYNGKTIPAGEYDVETNEWSKGNDVFGKFKGTSTVLRNKDTGTVYEIRSTSSDQERGAWRGIGI